MENTGRICLVSKKKLFYTISLRKYVLINTNIGYF